MSDPLANEIQQLTETSANLAASIAKRTPLHASQGPDFAAVTAAEQARKDEVDARLARLTKTAPAS